MSYTTQLWVDFNTLLIKAEVYGSNQSFDLDAPDFNQEQENHLAWKDYTESLMQECHDEFITNYYV